MLRAGRVLLVLSLLARGAAGDDGPSRVDELEHSLRSASVSLNPKALRTYLLDPRVIANEGPGGYGSLRAPVAELLGFRGDAEACEVLWRVAHDDETPSRVRFRAAEALLRMGEPTHSRQALKRLVLRARPVSASRSPSRRGSVDTTSAARSAAWLAISGDWSELDYLLDAARGASGASAALQSILVSLHWGGPSQGDVDRIAVLVDELLVPGQKSVGSVVQIAEALIALHGIRADRYASSLAALAEQPGFATGGKVGAVVLLRAIEGGEALSLGGREASLFRSDACAEWRPKP